MRHGRAGNTKTHVGRVMHARTARVGQTLGVYRMCGKGTVVDLRGVRVPQGGAWPNLQFGGGVGRGGGGGDESKRHRAESQWIVAARPLCHLQYPVAYLSRLQRIQPAARRK